MPPPAVRYTPQPYVRPRYEQGSTIGEILRLQGQQQAEAELRRGDLQAQMWSNLGNQITGTINTAMQERRDAPRRAQEDEARAIQLRNAKREEEAAARLPRQDSAFMALLEQQPNPDPREVMTIYGPERGLAIAQGYKAFLELQSGAVKDARESAGRLAIGAKASSPQMLSQFWPQIKAAAVKGGLGSVDEIPDQPTPEYLDGVIGWATGKAPTQAEGFTLNPGDVRFGADGKQIASVPKPVETQKPVEVNEGALLIDPVTGKVIARGNPKRAAEPVTRYQPREVLGDDGQQVTANYDAITGRHIDPRTNQPIKNPRRVPGAAETQDARKFKQAEPILSGVSELSERINTQQGAIAKIRGGVEKAKAQANYNDDVAEYEALISGFTPLVARALGHTGVLTQQDVDSVKALFPRPGDSKSLRDRKITRIKSIIGELETGADPAARKPVTITSIVEVP